METKTRHSPIILRAAAKLPPEVADEFLHLIAESHRFMADAWVLYRIHVPMGAEGDEGTPRDEGAGRAEDHEATLMPLVKSLEGRPVSLYPRTPTYLGSQLRDLPGFPEGLGRKTVRRWITRLVADGRIELASYRKRDRHKGMTVRVLQ